MLRFAADENFNNNIIRGLLRRQPELDIVRVQDVGLRGADDPTVLEWAAQEGRILLTHDVATITLNVFRHNKKTKNISKDRR
jgi:predicted nuclease of predicted toxin-antitoxin system